jgi:hypothetical protein
MIYRAAEPGALFPSLRKGCGAVGVTAMTMKWKLYTRDENPSPPGEGFEPKQHDSKDDALEAAWQMQYGPTGNRHLKILYIEEPDGNRIEAAEIHAWFKALR